MNFLVTLLLLVALAAVVWAVGVALYYKWLGGPNPLTHPLFCRASALAAVLVGALTLAGFPVGYLLSLAVWAFTVKNILTLPWLRALALFVILAVLSLLSWVALLGLLAL